MFSAFLSGGSLEQAAVFEVVLDPRFQIIKLEFVMQINTDFDKNAIDQTFLEVVFRKPSVRKCLRFWLKVLEVVLWDTV